MSSPTTREVLIGSALRLFPGKGYESTTVDDIARSAGLTTGAIYASFTSKEHLMAEAVAYAEDVFEAAMLDAVQRAQPRSSARDRLALYLRVTASLMESAASIMAFRSIVGIELSRQPQIAKTYGDIFARRREFCLSLVEDVSPVAGALSREDLVDVTLLAAEGLAALPVAGLARPNTSIPAVAEVLEHLLLATAPRALGAPSS